ncbi:MAG: hypothetical protein V1838_01285 [Patescibacteria group bacterium]
MKMPKIFLALIIILLIISIIFIALQNDFIEGVPFDLKANVSDFFLILTFIALLIYAYYTYLIAKDAWSPSASFYFQPHLGNQYYYDFFITNHSKLSLQCWCKLNATLNNQIINLGGFYSGESSFDVQPFAKVKGHFAIKYFLDKTSFTFDELEKIDNYRDLKNGLHLNIEFWYNPIQNKKDKIKNPSQPYFYDFKRKMFIAKF